MVDFPPLRAPPSPRPLRAPRGPHGADHLVASGAHPDGGLTRPAGRLGVPPTSWPSRRAGCGPASVIAQPDLAPRGLENRARPPPGQRNTPRRSLPGPHRSPVRPRRRGPLFLVTASHGQQDGQQEERKGWRPHGDGILCAAATRPAALVCSARCTGDRRRLRRRDRGAEGGDGQARGGRRLQRAPRGATGWTPPTPTGARPPGSSRAARSPTGPNNPRRAGTTRLFADPQRRLLGAEDHAGHRGG